MTRAEVRLQPRLVALLWSCALLPGLACVTPRIVPRRGVLPALRPTPSARSR